MPNPELQVGAFSTADSLAIFSARRTPLVTAAATLTVAQSGSICLWNLAAGFTYTLPAITAPDVGTNFRFIVTVSATSVAHKVITPASVFLVGQVLEGILDTTPAANPGPKYYTADGTTARSVSMAGTTTGGLIGTDLFLVAISTTQWALSGTVAASGTIATPIATS